jgi:hypothetical protein
VDASQNHVISKIAHDWHIQQVINLCTGGLRVVYYEATGNGLMSCLKDWITWDAQMLRLLGKKCILCVLESCHECHPEIWKFGRSSTSSLFLITMVNSDDHLAV